MSEDIKAEISKKIEGIENKIAEFSEKAKADIANTGKISTENTAALDKLGEKQLEIAARLLNLEQKGGANDPAPKPQGWGAQFTNSGSYKNFVEGNTRKAFFEIQNNTVGVGDIAQEKDRRPGIVQGPSQPLTLEDILNKVPTTKDAIEYVREGTFSNNAAEVAEKALKPESDITFNSATVNIANVAHWIKISTQLAADSPALQAYIETRMRYGVNRRVETQLAVGNGTTPNIGGLFKAGNFTPHGYALAALTSTVSKKLELFRRIIADLTIAGYPGDAILMNPMDWAVLELDMLGTPALQGQVRVDEMGNTRLWGLPIIQSIGVAPDTFLIGSFRQAATLYVRSDVKVEMFEQDVDNVQKNLITLRAERRLALSVEVPAAIRGGDLTPA
jgi:HK97 family phage major capsid protein